MNRRSTGGVPEEWRKQALSGQCACRTSTGAARRGSTSQNHQLREVGRLLTRQAAIGMNLVGLKPDLQPSNTRY